MNLIEAQHIRKKPKASELSTWMLARGISSMTTQEIAQLLHIPPDQVRVRLSSQRRAGAIVSPARGFWIPVPPDRILWGAPEPNAYINDMMSHLKSDYYVGWLSAAFFHGVSHQAIQEFQVATSKNIPDREVGRSRLRFFLRSQINKIPTVRIATSSSFVRVSSVGATMLDITADPDISGGLNNVATVVSELAWENDNFMNDVLAAAPAHNTTALRRLGWILEHIANIDELDALMAVCAARNSAPSYLAPRTVKDGYLDTRWSIFINKEVDPDL